jgi:hypothetical protein
MGLFFERLFRKQRSLSVPWLYEVSMTLPFSNRFEIPHFAIFMGNGHFDNQKVKSKSKIYSR